MKESMRKEIKIGLLIFVIFNTLKFIMSEIGVETPALHFFLGGLAGVAFAEIAIGLLPEPIYLKVKNFKRSILR